MAPDPRLKVSDVLIYLDIMVQNTIHAIGQVLTAFFKMGTYGE